jgi:hypothetical protein
MLGRQVPSQGLSGLNQGAAQQGQLAPEADRTSSMAGSIATQSVVRTCGRAYTSVRMSRRPPPGAGGRSAQVRPALAPATCRPHHQQQHPRRHRLQGVLGPHSCWAQQSEAVSAGQQGLAGRVGRPGQRMVRAAGARPSSRRATPRPRCHSWWAQVHLAQPRGCRRSRGGLPGSPPTAGHRLSSGVWSRRPQWTRATWRASRGATGPRVQHRHSPPSTTRATTPRCTGSHLTAGRVGPAMLSAGRRVGAAHTRLWPPQAAAPGRSAQVAAGYVLLRGCWASADARVVRARVR